MSKQTSPNPPDSPTPSKVGYKSPPIDKQFKPGVSGNRRGRPTGHNNIANMTKTALNRRVKVRSDGKIVEMRAAEAIFRVLTNKATQGNTRAATLVSRLRDMAGIDSDLTEEDLGKLLRLPLSFVGEEADLCLGAAREKDRQRYLAMAEFDESSPDPETRASNADIPAAIKAGDRFAANLEFEKALGSYRSQIVLCKQELTADTADTTAQYNFRRTVARIGLIADKYLYAGEFDKALDVAQEALEEAASGFWTMPEMLIPTNHHNTIWIGVIRGLALMFLEPLSGASARFFRSFQGDKKIAFTSWEYIILQEFGHFREMGYMHPVMEEIEQHFFEVGWVIDTKADIRSNINGTYTADITCADALSSQGKLDQAAALSLHSRDLRGRSKKA